MYEFTAYGRMIEDRMRVAAYGNALRQAIRPGVTVLEIGTGPGFFAILASQLGARRVFAIEPSDIIQVARENAAANQCGDRIEFIQDLSTKVMLQAKVDIIVSDLRGILPLFQLHIPSIIDARQRFLAPGGILIPQEDKIWAGVIEAPKTYEEIVGPWEHSGLNMDLSPARRIAASSFQKARFRPEQLLATPQLWATLDYAKVESPDCAGEVAWIIERAGVGHGIALWFDAILGEGIHFSNAPGSPELIYGMMYFPWERPVLLSIGQSVRVKIEAKLIGNDYVWRWTSHVCSLDESRKTITRFDQSILDGSLFSPARLRMAASNHVPKISEEGWVDRRVLELMDGHTSLEGIARRITEEFPQKFARWEDALAHVGTLSQKYSR
jgi:type I protein arginine methyltransferase